MTFRLSELRGAHDFHRHPDVQVLLLGNLKAGRGQDMAYENRAAIDKVGKVPMRPLISLVNQSVLSLFGHAHYPYLSQARELEKLSGETRIIKIDNCDSPAAGELLRILGFRMRGGCGSEVVLETVNAPRSEEH